MHMMLKVAIITTSLGFISTGFAAEQPQAPVATTQTSATAPAAPTSDQVLTGSAAPTSTSQPTTQTSALTHDHDEDMD